MTHTRTEVLAHAKRLMRFPNPIACSAFLELELMAEGDYLDDGLAAAFEEPTILARVIATFKKLSPRSDVCTPFRLAACNVPA